MNFKVTDTIEYIGVNDKKIDLFESQYVVPNGISYNSYLIKDEKNVVMDTVDKVAKDEWFDNLDKVLCKENIDYFKFQNSSNDEAICRFRFN